MCRTLRFLQPVCFGQIIYDPVFYTNMHGRVRVQNTWVERDFIEIEALLGLLLFSGVRKQNIVATHEVCDSIDGVSIGKACMSMNRSKRLVLCLRFDDKTTRTAKRAKDAFSPVTEMWDIFYTNLTKHYTPRALLQSDEQLFPFRGQCNFLQYLLSKPGRYSTRHFELPTQATVSLSLASLIWAVY